MNIFKIISVATSVAALTACAPTIQLRPTENLPQGLQKTVSAQITPGFTVINAVRVTHNVLGPHTETPVEVGNNVRELALSASETLPEGQPVNVIWQVDYRLLLFPETGTRTATNTFTVGPQAQINLPIAICLRQGELKVVQIDLTPTNLTADVALSVAPASLATPSPNQVTVGPAGNSINIQGVQLGQGTLEATAPAFASDNATLKVIEPLATPALTNPANNATQVFFGMSPPPGQPATVTVQLDWQDVPGANEYRIFFAEDNGPFTFTNSPASDILLAFRPGTVVHWKVAARFDACPTGTAIGPESEERVFTVWTPG